METHTVSVLLPLRKKLLALTTLKCVKEAGSLSIIHGLARLKCRPFVGKLICDRLVPAGRLLFQN